MSFIYQLPFSVRSFHPSSGMETGGTKILVTGEIEQTETEIFYIFGMKKASSTIKSPARFISQNKLECVQPTMVPGQYDFLIEINWDMSNIAGEFVVYSCFNY